MPSLPRFLALAIVAFGLLVVAAGVVLMPMNATPYFGIGGVLVLIGLIWLFGQRALRRMQTMPEGFGASDAVARWHVGRADWEAFTTIDRARSGRLWSLANELDLPGEIPPEGYDVVIAGNAAAVGPRYFHPINAQLHWLGDVRWYDGNPGFIELTRSLRLSTGQTVTVLRIPVPVAAQREAATAVAYLQTLVGEPAHGAIRRRYRAHFEAAEQTGDAPHRVQARRKPLVIGLGLFVAALVGFLLYNAMAPRGPGPSAARDPGQVSSARGEQICDAAQTAKVNALAQRTLKEAGVFSDARLDPRLAKAARSTRAEIGETCGPLLDQMLDKIAGGYMAGEITGPAYRDESWRISVDGIVF